MSAPGTAEERATVGRGRLAWVRDRARRVLSEGASRDLLLTVMVGVLGGLVAFLFHALSHLMWVALFPGRPRGILEAFAGSPWWLRLTVPAAGGLAAGLVKMLFLPGGKSRGMPEILEAVTIGAGLLKLRRAVPTGVASLLAYGTGGSVGREGAIVQIASAFASWLGRRLRVERATLRMLVGCGVAAGIASAYRTPVAGALFALEVIYRRFAFQELGPIVVASVAATMTSYVLVGSSPIYAVATFRVESFGEYLPYLAVGILGGVTAVLLQRSLDLASRGFRRLPIPAPVVAMTGGLLVGLLSLVLPEVTGNGYEVLRRVLGSQEVPAMLAVILGAKILATCFTVGSGGPGGVFTPSLLIGAAMGGAVGGLVEERFPEHVAESGAYALVGMACVLAATTRAPLMAIMMVIETTLQHSLILPVMMAVVASYAVAAALERDSIYTAELRRRGIVWEAERQADLLQRRQVGELVRPDVPLLPENLPLPVLLRIFRESRELYLYVGDGAGRLRGVIDLHDLKDFLGQEAAGSGVVAADLAREVPPLSEQDSLGDAERRLRGLEVGHLPVVDTRENGHYLGVLQRRDLAMALERALVMGEDAAGDGGLVLASEPGRGRLCYTVAPEELVGRLAAEIPEETLDGTIVAIRRTGGAGEVGLLGAVDTTLRRGDVLVVLPRPN